MPVREAMLSAFVLFGLACQAERPPVEAKATAAVVRKADAVAQLPLRRDVSRALASIQRAEAMEHIRTLASPAFAGREAGRAGARAAADYIAAQFRRSGLQAAGSAGTFFQTFKIRPGYRIESVLKVRAGQREEIYKRGVDYMPVHVPKGHSRVEGACLMVGYGLVSEVLRFNEYGGVNALGKAVVVFGGVPWGAETSSWIRRAERPGFASLADKAQTAAQNGATLMLVVEAPAGWRRRVDVAEELRLPDREFPITSPIPIVQITWATAQRMTGMRGKDLQLLAREVALERAPQSRVVPGCTVSFDATISGRARIGRNVIGIHPGIDRERRKEAVVIGAHYDHLGEDAEGTFFGANDNASGVSAMLEIAQAFSLLEDRPKRSIVFVAFAAEEIGQLGSSYYVSRAPISAQQTVLMINFDMIGRNEVNEVKAVGTRSSPELHTLHQQVNEHVGLKLDHPRSFRLGRSDHTAFFRAGIPIMYLFGGLHEGYHTPEDLPKDIHRKKVERVARLAFLTAWNVAERTQRISFGGGED